MRRRATWPRKPAAQSTLSRFERCISPPSWDETNRHRPKNEIKTSTSVGLGGGTGLVPPGELAKADPVAVRRRAAAKASVRILRVMVELPGAVAPPRM